MESEKKEQLSAEAEIPEVRTDYRESDAVVPVTETAEVLESDDSALPQADPLPLEFSADAAENSEQIAENEPQPAESESAEENIEIKHASSPPRRPKHRYGFAVGVVVLLFALFGVGSLVSMIGGQIAAVWKDTYGPQNWEPFLEAVVRNDPEPFETVADAKAEDLCAAAVWKAAAETEEAAYDSLGRLILSETAVEAAYQSLFGTAQSFRAGDGVFYSYDGTDFFVVPLSEKSGYMPVVSAEEKTENGYILQVSYIAAADPWKDNAAEAQTLHVVKQMEYTVVSGDTSGSYVIAAIRACETEE